MIATRRDPAQVIKPAVAQVQAIDPEQPATDVKTIETLLQEESYAGPRFNLVLFTAFAALGLMLATIGVFGVMSSPTRGVAARLQARGWPPSRGTFSRR